MGMMGKAIPLLPIMSTRYRKELKCNILIIIISSDPKLTGPDIDSIILPNSQELFDLA